MPLRARIISRFVWIVLISVIMSNQYSQPVFNATKSFSFTENRGIPLKEFNAIALNKKLDRKKAKIPNDHPEQFAAYQRAIRTREGKTFSDYSTGYQLRELDQARKNPVKANARKSEYIWTEHGPGNVPGRTRAILILPGDNTYNTWLAGSVGGGIWKTMDGGMTWINKSTMFPNLATTSLAFSESNPDIIYAGTGESYGSGGLIEVLGQGMFKSQDGGETWEHLQSSIDQFENLAINHILVDPQDPDILLISTNQNIGRGLSFNSGIYKSVDGGVNWNQVYQPAAWVQQLIYKPGNFNVQYAAVYAEGLARSLDGGNTWDLISEGLLPGGRFEIAISESNTNLMYASAEGELSGVESDFYISEDGGENWKLVIEENDLPNRNFFSATATSPAQGGWDNTIAVHPFNNDIIYVGGVDLYKMTMKEGEKTGDRNFKRVSEIDTETFMDFVDFGAEYWNGRLSVGDIPLEQFVSVEIRFGSGLKQKAHRFIVPTDGGISGDGGAGIPDSLYAYVDYVDVPFEVWDIENNKQLMVSFRDQARNGVWDLIPNNTDGSWEQQSREYYFIHTIEYNPSSPDPTITSKGGQVISQMYNMWPYLAEGAAFGPGNLPASKLVVEWGEVIKRYRQTERMTTWSGTGEENGRVLPYIHADQHNIIPVVTDEISSLFKLVATNDGGVFQSTELADPGMEVGTWQFAGKGFNTSQFYGVDKKPGENEFIGGLQDNGTVLSPLRESAISTTDYIEVGGGDGMETVWNYGNENEIIISIYNNQFSKTTDGGETWFDVQTGLTDVGNKAPFISKLGNSKTKPEVLFTVGESGVWKSDNFGNNWNLSPLDEYWVLSSTMDVEVSLSNYNIVWAGAGMTENARIFVSTDHGITFNTVNNYTDVDLGAISGIATHPFDDSTAYMLFSFAGAPKILRTTDLGETWTDISGFGSNNTSDNGFPNVAVHSLIVLPNDPNIIWAGTEIGIFESVDNGGNWALLASDFPSVSTWDMKQVDDQIVVGTHGRGIWSAAIPDLPEIAVSPEISQMGVSPGGELVLAVKLRSSYDSTLVYLNGINQAKIESTPKTEGQIIFNYPFEEKVTSTLHSFINGFELVSNTDSIDFYLLNEVVNEYVNEFESEADEAGFTGNGFSITTNPEFDPGDYAIHSMHNYSSNSEYIYYLKTPVKIAETEANFLYEDIAIVEKGEAGTKFGDVEFWDYVVVEGTLDGVSWLPLKDGYDASFNSFWSAAYGAKLPGNKNLYVKQNINLLNTFNPGDTVLFRFRLFSDQFTVGWGWVIDNIYIQEPRPVGIADELNAGTFKTNIYPNPFSDRLTFEVNLDKPATVQIEILDISGKRVDLIRIDANEKGNILYDYPAATLKKGLYLINFQAGNKQSVLKIVKD